MLHFKPMLIRRRWNLRRGVLGVREFGLLFGRFSLGHPFEEFQKMAYFGVFAKLAIAQNCEHFWSRRLRQNVVRWLHFKSILIRRRWDFLRGFLGARDFGLFFGRFSLGAPFEEFQKVADFGVFAKLAIAQSCEHFWSRGLRQNVVRWLHFKSILIRRRWDFRRCFLGAHDFPLLPPLKNFRQMADFGVLAKLAIAQSCKHFLSRGLRQNVVWWLHFKSILIRRRWGFRRGFLGARDFPLLPSLKNFRQMADFGIFAKLAIARSCELSWSRGLWQNVFRWLHFRPMLITKR